MSYYTINQSRPTPTGPQTGFTQGQDSEFMRPLLTAAGGFRTRDVNRNETVQGQLDGLLRSDSSYLTRARNRSANSYAARGGLNTSAAAGAAEGAAIDAALPVAAQDASWFGQTHRDNMGAENEYLRQQSDIAGNWNIANLQAGTQGDIAALNRDEERRQFDLAQGENTRRYDLETEEGRRRYDEDYRREAETQQRTNTMNRNNFISTGIFNTVFQDPSIWRDPAAAMGFASYYGQNFLNLWDQMFPSSPVPAAP